MDFDLIECLTYSENQESQVRLKSFERKVFEVFVLILFALILILTAMPVVSLGGMRPNLFSIEAFAAYQERLQQTTFSAEEPIKRPVPLPKEVLRALRRDRRTQTCLSPIQSPAQMPASWFVASEISLSRKSSKDLIVMPVNACLYGANVVPFWVFRNSGGRYLLSLNVSAFALEVLQSRTAGYRDIRASSVTANNKATVVYKFHRGGYVAERQSPTALNLSSLGRRPDEIAPGVRPAILRFLAALQD